MELNGIFFVEGRMRILKIGLIAADLNRRMKNGPFRMADPSQHLIFARIFLAFLPLLKLNDNGIILLFPAPAGEY